MMVHLVFLYIYYSLPFMLPIVIIASRTGEFYLCLGGKDLKISQIKCHKNVLGILLIDHLEIRMILLISVFGTCK